MINDRLCTGSFQWQIHRLHTGIAKIITQIDVIEIKATVNDTNYNSSSCIRQIKVNTLVHIIDTREVPDTVTTGQKCQRRCDVLHAGNSLECLNRDVIPDLNRIEPVKLCHDDNTRCLKKIVLEFTPTADEVQIRFSNGSWAAHPGTEDPYKLYEENKLEIELTQAILDEMIANGGLVITGQGYTLTAVILK